MSLLQPVGEDAPHLDYHHNAVQRSDDSNADTPRGRGTGVILGCWLYGVFVIAIAGRVETSVISSIARVALATGILWPLLYFMFGNCRFTPTSIKTGSLVAILLFAFFAFASLLASVDIYMSASYLVLTLGALFIALQFNTNLSPQSLESGLRIYAILMAASLVWVIFDNYVPGERLWVQAAGYNPNSLALVGLSAAVAAMAFRNIAFRCCVIAVPLVVLFLTNSRSAGVGAVAALGVIVFMRMKAADRSTRTLMIALLGILTAVYFRDPLSASISDFLQLKDEYRGLGTGATGREVVWHATWKLFVDNPIFGVGFRAHEARLGGESSHNGYLALLAEIGLVGFMAVMYLIATGVASLYTLAAKKENVFSCSILLGLVVGFLIVSLYERYLLNVGNPTSLLFIVAITVACRRTAERNHAQETGAIRQWQILP